MIKIAVFVANGTEEIESMTVVDILRRADLYVDIITMNEKQEFKGSHNVVIQADKLISEISATDYDHLVIPGGMPGAANVRDNQYAIQMIQNMYAAGKFVCSICAGPISLAKAGILKGHEFTSYPGFETAGIEAGGKYNALSVCQSKNIITGSGPAFAMEFALQIVEAISGKSARMTLEKDLLLR